MARHASPQSMTADLRRVRSLALRAPVIALVLAFTAVPAELRPVHFAEALDLSLDIPDVIANIVGYVPLGAVMANQGIASACAVAGAVSLFAEVTQLFTKGRSSSLLDLLTNIIGAAIGVAICARWKLDLSRVAIGRPFA